MVEAAQQRLVAAGLTERCAIQAGDFFEAVPPGGDAYLVKWILHDWDDERSIGLLKNCHRAMTRHSKLLVVEAVIPPGNTPFLHKWMDLTMLVMLGGRERTEAEYRALFEAAGFKLMQIIPTASEMSVIEGIRV